jgi:hypothetical protein
MLFKGFHFAKNLVVGFIQSIMDAQQLRADLFLKHRGYVWHEETGSFRWIGR